MEIKWIVEEHEEENVLLKTFLKKAADIQTNLDESEVPGRKSQSKRTPCKSP